MTGEARRVGDLVEIPGDYQHRATYHGYRPQRFWHQARFQISFEMLEIEPGMVLLDVGCGSGVFVRHVAEQCDATVIGVDANPRAIEFATGFVNAAGVSFRLCDLDSLDLPEASVDRVSLLEVIEHIHRDQAARLISRAAQWLRPGGRLVLSTPNRRSLWPVVEWVMDRSRLVAHMGGDQHVHLYSRSQLQALTGHGLECRVVRSSLIVSPAVALLDSRLARILERLERRTPCGCLLFASFEKASGGT